MTPGDTLITLRTVGPLRRGDVVTVASTCADGEYLYLDGQGPQAFRAEYFLVAVRRPWHAWADPEWGRMAREAAERFVREGIALEAPDPRDADLALAPVATVADALRAKVAALAQEYAEIAGRNMSYEMRRPRELLDYHPDRSPWRAREGSYVRWPARFARDLRRILRALAEKETER